MTNLTEQMRQGTLPVGEYWVKFNGDIGQLSLF